MLSRTTTSPLATVRFKSLRVWRCRNELPRARAWICSPVETSEFITHNISELMHQVTIDYCRNMNTFVTLAHEVDDKYFFDTAMTIIYFFLGFIGALISIIYSIYNINK